MTPHPGLAPASSLLQKGEHRTGGGQVGVEQVRLRPYDELHRFVIGRVVTALVVDNAINDRQQIGIDLPQRMPKRFCLRIEGEYVVPYQDTRKDRQRLARIVTELFYSGSNIIEPGGVRLGKPVPER